MLDKYTYRRARVNCDAHSSKMLIEREIKRDLLLASSNNQIVGSRFHIVQYFKGMRFYLISISHIPHVEALRENEH